jgi:hypothetical protein
MPMRSLYFKLYNAGLSNCRMSLEVGVGLAYLTNRTLVPYAVKAPWTSEPLPQFQKERIQRATVLDLFHLPVPVDRQYEPVVKLKKPHPIRPWTGGVYDAAFIMDSNSSPDSEDFCAFRNRRHHVWTLSQAPSDDGDLLIDNDTLGFCSHFFYGAPSRLSELHSVLRRIRPRSAYRELAKRIADSLAPFNAVHIRRGDFCSSGISPRSGRVPCSEITKNISTRLSRNDRLLVCTDSSSDKRWFAPLLKHFRDVVFVDQVLQNTWMDEFRALPFHDDSVMALLTQLVAEEAQCFVGTPFSTFTALIQRARGLNRKQSKFLYCYSDWDPLYVPFRRCKFLQVQDGPYSWNRILYPIMPGVHSWFREWPESFQSAIEPNGNTATTDGTVLLQARDASIHGTEARYEQSYLLDNIGYWENPEDHISWEFPVARAQPYRLSIRYACPQECAGASFLVELSNGEYLSGITVDTGDWIIFSSWLQLGKTSLSSGWHKLTVRILTMSGHAAMNLVAVRLTPITGPQ